jgi:hypothetical protein
LADTHGLAEPGHRIGQEFSRGRFRHALLHREKGKGDRPPSTVSVPLPQYYVLIDATIPLIHYATKSRTVRDVAPSYRIWEVVEA